MKTKKILLMFIPILALFALLGASGTLKIDSAAESETPDKLVGVFITNEHLDMPFPEDRIYADGTEFTGLEGIRCFFTLQEDSEGSYYKTTADDGASDRITHFTTTDNGEKIEQELTLYMERRPGNWTLFMNPVYQSGDGAIYVQTGQGMRCPADTAGESASYTLSEENSYTDGRETKTDSSHIKVTVQVIDRTETVRVLKFDGEYKLISTETYKPEDVPDSFRPSAETAYIIVECVNRDLNGAETTQRTLYQPTDEYFESFSGTNNGLLIKHQTEIEW